jgi:hypothetical protein
MAGGRWAGPDLRTQAFLSLDFASTILNVSVGAKAFERRDGPLRIQSTAKFMRWRACTESRHAGSARYSIRSIDRVSDRSAGRGLDRRGLSCRGARVWLTCTEGGDRAEIEMVFGLLRESHYGLLLWVLGMLISRRRIARNRSLASRKCGGKESMGRPKERTGS